MGMASGESDIHLGIDVGQWGAQMGRRIFLGGPAEGGKFFLPHVSRLKMLTYLWRNQV